MDFQNIKFNGEFRTYQQKVLDNSYKFLKDKKIHIVAAPGSGKTILGLELIKRQNERALILSPSVTIREQWRDRFADNFIESGTDIDSLFSFDLKKPLLITSITYQALHAAIQRQVITTKENEECDDVFEIETDDFTNFDIIKTMKDNNIKTICLDEAHHLRSEWQKSLETFINNLDDDITIISLTATPPYDSTLLEWKKYTSVCGDIDDEIFVPELVKNKTICPHQDYVIFSYPTNEEKKKILNYKKKATDAVMYASHSEAFKNIIDYINTNYQQLFSLIYENYQSFLALEAIASYVGLRLSSELLDNVNYSMKSNNLDLSKATLGFQFILDNQDLFKNDAKEIKTILQENGVIERKKVVLELDERMKRILSTSLGKLDSISLIAKSEANNLKSNLRMLILTDYIKRESLKNINKNHFPDINIISIFKTVLDSNTNLNIGILSGSLVVIPNSLKDMLIERAKTYNLIPSFRKLPDLDYSEVIMGVENRLKVLIITKLFEDGNINILIGTKALLGEGWDSPCINSIILASFIGSYMMSNQMRGRAIRVNALNENKVANIFHLATIEPEEYTGAKKIISSDYEMIKKRFDCFLAPRYDSDSIETGIDRLKSIIKAPYGKEGFIRINNEMLEKASKRELTAKRWQSCLEINDNPVITENTELPYKVFPRSFFIQKLQMYLFLLITTVLLISFTLFSLIKHYNFEWFIMTIGILFTIFTTYTSLYIFHISNPKRFVENVSKEILKSLKQTKYVLSPNALITRINDKTNKKLYMSITNATMHEQNLFNRSLYEFFSPITYPRYIVVNNTLGGLNFKYSYQLPAIFGNNKQNATIFYKNMRFVIRRLKLIYTKSDKGKEIYTKAKRFTLTNNNTNIIFKKTLEENKKSSSKR